MVLLHSESKSLGISLHSSFREVNSEGAVCVTPGCLCEAHIQILLLFLFAVWETDLTSVLALITSWPFHQAAGVCYAFQCLEFLSIFRRKRTSWRKTWAMLTHNSNGRGYVFTWQLGFLRTRYFASSRKQTGLFCHSCWVLLTCRSSEAGLCWSHSVLGLMYLLLQVPEWYSGSHESSGDGSAPSVSEGGDSVSAWWVSKHIKDSISERTMFPPRRSTSTLFNKDYSNFVVKLSYTGFLLKICQSAPGFCRGAFVQFEFSW